MGVPAVEQEELYDFDGYLVFNGLYSTKVLNPDFDLERVVNDELKDFKPGSIDQPGSGYRVLPFVDSAKESHYVSASLVKKLSDVTAFRYEWEEWDTGEVQGDAGIENRAVRETKSVDVFWQFPHFLFIKGDKTQTRKMAKLLGVRLDEYVVTNEITFSPDFLLWVLAKYKNNETLTDRLQANLLRDASIEGDEDRFGERNVVDNSTDIAQAPNILMGILRGKEITKIEGVFETDGMFVNAEIESDGRVHIKAEEDIHGAKPIERMSISLAFLIELISLFSKWQELDPGEKYPPIEFFEVIYEECSAQGTEITFPVNDVIEHYRQKGSRDEFTERQTGLEEY